ncbi:MAG: transglutaminase family protein [Leptospirillum sp.]
MIYEISHRMDFSFTDPVFFEPMTVRLRPRSDASQTLLTHRLAIMPEPDRVVDCIGMDGNIESILWFSGVHGKLVIHASSRVQTLRINPFDFLLPDPQNLTLPFEGSRSWPAIFAPYLDSRPITGKAFEAFAKRIILLSNKETVPFLTCLAKEIHDSLAYNIREDGPPRSPEETLRQGEGSCRDFALLAMKVCQFFGIPARFASGYHLPPLSRQPPSLHAWLEVYLPGAGWRGLDPSEGVMTAEHHVTLVSSPVPHLTLPTDGTFRGSGKSSLSPTIDITSIAE